LAALIAGTEGNGGTGRRQGAQDIALLWIKLHFQETLSEDVRGSRAGVRELWFGEKWDHWIMR
jgi:hypothetical protein